MKLLRTGLTAIALAAAACGGAQAAPLFVGGGNELIYNNFETPFRLSSDCTITTCLPFVVGQDPTDANGNKWQQVDGRVPGNTRVGDVFVGILRASSNNAGINGAGGPVWVPGLTTDIFTGYFVQQVKAIDATTFPINYLSLGTAAIDPFGVLNTAGGVMFGLYANGTTGLSAVGSIIKDISIAVGLGGGPLVAGAMRRRYLAMLDLVRTVPLDRRVMRIRRPISVWAQGAAMQMKASPIWHLTF